MTKIFKQNHQFSRKTAKFSLISYLTTCTSLNLLQPVQ